MRCFRSLRRKRKIEFFDSRKKAQDVRREEVRRMGGARARPVWFPAELEVEDAMVILDTYHTYHTIMLYVDSKFLS